MKYSIIIPHYNRPDLIINTINSFKELKDKEIIIVDDLSTKENLNKLKDNVKKINDPLISIITPPHKLFLPGSRNKGIELAKGKWIFFIDDDDEATPGFIRWLNSNKQKEKYDFYRFPYLVCGINKKSTFKIKRWFLKNFLYSFQVSTYLIKKEYLEKNKVIFNEKIIKFGEDIEFSQKLHFIGHPKFKYKNTISIKYNTLNNDSICRNKIKNLTLQMVAIEELNHNHWYKTFVIIILWFMITMHIKNDRLEDIKGSKKQLINIFDQSKIKFIDIVRLDFLRLIRYCSFKKSIKKWRKELNIK